MYTYMYILYIVTMCCLLLNLIPGHLELPAWGTTALSEDAFTVKNYIVTKNYIVCCNSQIITCFRKKVPLDVLHVNMFVYLRLMICVMRC